MSKLYPNAIRYAGAKSKQLDFIYNCFPSKESYDSFVDLFGGGGSVILNAPVTKKDIYNDIDEEIVNFFRVLRTNGAELMEALRLTPYSRTEYDDAFIFDARDDEIERARKIAIKAQFSYGGQGGGFKAYEREVSITQMYKNWIDGLSFVIDRFRSVTIENMDALKLLKKVDSPKTLVYVDPPYLGTDDYEHNYSEEQHEKLLKGLIDAKAMVVISGVPSAMYDKYLQDWVKIDKPVVNSSFKKSSTRLDILWIKPNITKCNRFGLFGGGVLLMCQVTFDLNSVTLDMFFDFSPEFEDRFHNHGCINWNLYLEWIEENTEDILADFNKSGYENIDDFCLDDWRM